LGGLLNPSANFQILYQILVAVWLLSYNEKIRKEGFAPSGIIPKIVEILKSAAKEKVLRICLAILKNLIDQSSANNEQMIEHGGIKIIETLSAKRWGDEDIVEDIDGLKDSLQKNLTLLR
jgi:V-type H+-transporting ATPase subunit H